MDSSEVRSTEKAVSVRRAILGVGLGIVAGIAVLLGVFSGWWGLVVDPRILQLAAGLAIAAFFGAILFIRGWRLFAVLFVLSGFISLVGAFLLVWSLA